MKKIITLAMVSMLLVSCNAPNNQAKEDTDSSVTQITNDENSDDENLQKEEEQEIHERQNRQYQMVVIYQNGEKYEVQVLPHGDHYHVIFDGVDYGVSEEEFQMIQKEDNQFLLGVGLRTEPPTIVSYEKIDDHWYVKYSDGTEDILYEDPAKIIEQQNSNK